MGSEALPFYLLLNSINRQVLFSGDIMSIIHLVNKELSSLLPSLNFCIEMSETELSCETYETQIPVQYGEKTVGSIFVDKLVDEELHTKLTMIADSIALAVEHLKLRDFKENFQDQIKAFRAILTTLHSRLNVEEVLEKILTNLGTVLSYKASNIHLLDINSTPQTYRIVHNRGYKDINKPEPQMGVAIPLENMPIYIDMIKTGKPYIVSDTYNDPDWTVFPETSWIRSYASAPIRFDNKVIGFINIDSDIPKYYTDKHAEILQLFADEISVTLYNAQLFESAQKANKELKKLAHLDGLTKVANRRCFNDTLKKEIDELEHNDSSLSLILIDIDYFKNYNDYYGHMQGDSCLIDVVKVMQSCVQRSNDLICRYGGEEFAVILPNANKSDAYIVAEKIRESVLESKIEHKRSKVAQYVTCSLGVTTVSTGDIINSEILINLADKALYKAKSIGRNRTEIEILTPVTTF